jgi:hypothetical protein
MTVKTIAYCRKCILASVFLLSALVAVADDVNVDDMGIAQGQTREFYVYLNNTKKDLVSFQMDVKLPEGLVINKNKCRLTNRLTPSGQELFVGEVGPNLYRFLSTSYEMTPMATVDEALLVISVTATEDYNGGTVNLRDLFSVSAGSVKASWTNVAFKANKIEAELGDVNGDTIADVTDCMHVVSYILDHDSLYSSAMDINKDEEIDVTDVLMIVEKILGN